MVSTDLTSESPDKFTTDDAENTCESLEKIREMLLVGLTSYGEIERLKNAQETHKVCGGELEEDLQVIHPTGSADTVSDFAEALINVDVVMRQIRDLAEQESVAPTQIEALDRPRRDLQ